jgi:hypothetical protein
LMHNFASKSPHFWTELVVLVVINVVWIVDSLVLVRFWVFVVVAGVDKLADCDCVESLIVLLEAVDVWAKRKLSN